MYKNIIKTWKIMKFLHSDNTHRVLLSFQLLLHFFLLATTSSFSPTPPPKCPICKPPFCCNFQTGSCEFCTFPCTSFTCGLLFCCGTSGFCMDCVGLQSVVSVPLSTPLGPLPDEGKDISSLITREMFEQMLLHRNNNDCPASGFYTYDAFITAAKSFPAFATTGDINARKREIAAFFAQTSHETTGGRPSAPDGPYSRGYCFVEEIGGGDYCVPNIQWPCVPGKQYFGRGPIQLSYNYKYGECGDAIGVDLLRNPDLIASDPVIAFKTALWFWMTPQPPKPSCHAVIIGEWVPSQDDQISGRIPEFGVTTNIINGGLECGIGPDARVESRVGFFKRYCDIFGISYGENLDCNNQNPFQSVATM